MFSTRHTIPWIIGFLLLGFLNHPGFADSTVQLWEEPLTIPTYEVGAPDPVPRFYEGRTYQGAQGRIYPYPMSDRLTDQKEEKTYRAIYLENEYIKICVLPEIGGRIFSAVDKTNGYDFFYRQHVIKPALIGMLGAWISGGVEWNIPHHHRSRSFMEMDSTLTENPDGSKTVWLGELERRHRMHFLLGLTLYPGKSYLEATVKIFNRTPYVNSFLYFANPAVQVNKDYQVIFPPETEFVTQHAKSEFSEWPISNSRYGGYDYRGVDISWWKNLPKSVSFFCWNYSSDFFAGYDHGKEAGVAYVADHYVAPGKKFFTFGSGEAGAMWDKMLTDNDGPYLELMAGAYSDNQPDYSWIQPYETKIFKQYWFPIRDLGGMKFANLNGAVNATIIDDSTAQFRVNTTADQKQAKLILRVADKVLQEVTADISPARPFLVSIPIPAGTKENALGFTLLSADSAELMNYQIPKQPGEPKPKTVVPPAEPEKIENNEQLYLAGLRLDQFQNASKDPMDYYKEALKRDPGDSRVNTQMGILLCKKGMFAEAEEKLQTAIDRVAANYTSPRDGEPYYYLGVAQKMQGKNKEAYDAFYKATWSWAWNAAGYYSLAELDCLKDDYPTALEHLDRAIAANAYNTKAYNLKSAVLRKLRRDAEAVPLLQQAITFDPLDFWTHNELAWAYPGGDQVKQQQNFMQTHAKDKVQEYLEIAMDYVNSGFSFEAKALLDTLEAEGKTDPMIYYLQGYLDHNNHTAYQKAASMTPDYCFPFRLESIAILRDAMERNPEDARAHYYLGNLLYDKQPDVAVQEWQKAADMNCDYYVLYRNLAYAFSRKNDEIALATAVAYMEKALKLCQTDPRIYFELDQMYEQQGVEPAKRLALLEKNQSVIALRDDVLEREVSLYVQTGEYDKAAELLTTHHFHTWEGGGSIHNIYVDAFLLRGVQRLNQQKYAEALSDFQTALLYPDNLEVAEPVQDDNHARIDYYIGLAYEKQGNHAEAQKSYQSSTTTRSFQPENNFYQGLSYQKLDKPEDAKKMFDRLIQSGTDRLNRNEAGDFFAKFGERQSPKNRQAAAHYLIGLGYRGNGDRDKAREEFQKALDLNINYYWAKQMLSDLQ